jgi:hypothetical protein
MEGVLRIFIALKNIASAGFEPANLESNGKSAKYCANKDDT